jgi:hypothetical protein
VQCRACGATAAFVCAVLVCALGVYLPPPELRRIRILHSQGLVDRLTTTQTLGLLSGVRFCPLESYAPSVGRVPMLSRGSSTRGLCADVSACSPGIDMVGRPLTTLARTFNVREAPLGA